MTDKKKMVWLGPEGFLPGIGVGRPGESIMMPPAEAENYERQKLARPYTGEDKKREEAAKENAAKAEKERAAKQKAQPKTTEKPPATEDKS